MTDEALLNEIATKREGGKYTNDPEDKGGPTRWGVTQRTLAGWRLRDVTPEEVERLTLEEALSIYRAQYLNGPGFAQISSAPVRALLVDMAINHGPRTAVELLQQAVGVRADGKFGPNTLAAVRLCSMEALWLRIFAERLELFGVLGASPRDADHDGHPDAQRFSEGWHNRLARLMRERAQEVH